MKHLITRFSYGLILLSSISAQAGEDINSLNSIVFRVYASKIQFLMNNNTAKIFLGEDFSKGIDLILKQGASKVKDIKPLPVEVLIDACNKETTNCEDKRVRFKLFENHFADFFKSTENCLVSNLPIQSNLMHFKENLKMSIALQNGLIGNGADYSSSDGRFYVQTVLKESARLGIDGQHENVLEANVDLFDFNTQKIISTFNKITTSYLYSIEHKTNMKAELKQVGSELAKIVQENCR